MTNWLDNIEDRVIEAYKAKGFKATSRTFCEVERPDGTTACCALTALYGMLGSNGEYVGHFAAAAGISDREQIWDFIFGFDTALEGKEYNYETTEAAKAGARVAARVKEAGLL